MNAINAIAGALVAALLAPFSAMPAWIPLCLIGALSGVAAAFVFRFTSPQKRIRSAADQVRAGLLGMRLFADDPLNALRAQGGIMKASGLRLCYSLPPMLVLAPLFAVLLGQLAMWYEFRPLPPRSAPHAENALIEVDFSESAWAASRDLSPTTADGITLDARVRDDQRRRITWRIATEKAVGTSTIRFPLSGSEAIDKQIVISPPTTGIQFVSPLRAGASWLERVLYPGEPGLPSSAPIQRIAIQYPNRETPIAGVNIPWWLTFFFASILGALLAKPFAGVQF